MKGEKAQTKKEKDSVKKLLKLKLDYHKKQLILLEKLNKKD